MGGGRDTKKERNGNVLQERTDVYGSVKKQIGINEDHKGAVKRFNC